MPRTIRHWTPRYILNRVLFAAQERLYPQDPWLTREACVFLDDWLQPEHRGIEWGSGRSTLWIARRIRHLISVEHDPQWYSLICNRLCSERIDNVDYRFAPLEQSDGTAVTTYEEVALELANSSVDFALVDGRRRDLCLQKVLPKLKPQGLLVLDNAEQFILHRTVSPSALCNSGQRMTELWQELVQQLASWKWVWTSNGVFDTALFVKPQA